MVELISAAELYSQIQHDSPISTGDPTLDDLLHGGLHPGPVYFFGSPSHLISFQVHMLANIIGNVFDAIKSRGLSEELGNILFIDAENRFDAYLIGKSALERHLSPEEVLKHIWVSRAFTWNQIVEILEEKTVHLPVSGIVAIIVFGITRLYEQTTSGDTSFQLYRDLARMFAGINHVAWHSHSSSSRLPHPLIILTSSQASAVNVRKIGGHLFAHYCGVAFHLHDTEQYYQYTLIKHPTLPPQMRVVWKKGKNPAKMQAKPLDPTKSMWESMDKYLHPPSSSPFPYVRRV